VNLVRRGVAELVVRTLSVDGVDLEPTTVSRLLARGRARTDASDRLRFDVPLNVTNISAVDGTITMTRDQYNPGTRPRAVR
jgi:hypothetical protein